jgi:hypothetical protein
MRVDLYKSADGDGDVEACAKCKGTVKKGDTFCQTCGSKLPEWGEDRAAETTPVVPSRQDASHLKDGEPGGPGTGKPSAVKSLEKRLYHEGVGAQHDAIRQGAREEWEANRLDVIGATIRKSSGAAEALVATIAKMTRDFKVDRNEALGLVLKSASGRALYDRARAESTVVV